MESQEREKVCDAKEEIPETCVDCRNRGDFVCDAFLVGRKYSESTRPAGAESGTETLLYEYSDSTGRQSVEVCRAIWEGERVLKEGICGRTEEDEWLDER